MTPIRQAALEHFKARAAEYRQEIFDYAEKLERYRLIALGWPEDWIEAHLALHRQGLPPDTPDTG